MGVRPDTGNGLASLAKQLNSESVKRYPEPMARGPEAGEPSHLCGSR